MDLALAEGWATLVVFLDGSTSLYYSSGGGVIGAGESAAVRAEHPALFAEAEVRLNEFTPAEDLGVPPPGQVRFFLRTHVGLFSAEGAQEELGEGPHPLSSLFHRAHDVISAVRESAGG